MLVRRLLLLTGRMELMHIILAVMYYSTLIMSAISPSRAKYIALFITLGEPRFARALSNTSLTLLRASEPFYDAPSSVPHRGGPLARSPPAQLTRFRRSASVGERCFSIRWPSVLSLLNRVKGATQISSSQSMALSSLILAWAINTSRLVLAATFIVLFVASFSTGLGPIPFVLMGEAPPSKVRGLPRQLVSGACSSSLASRDDQRPRAPGWD